MEIILSAKAQGFPLVVTEGQVEHKNILRRKQMHLESFNCVFCLTPQEETVEHLFNLAVSFAQQCWGLLNLKAAPLRTLWLSKISCYPNSSWLPSSLGNLDGPNEIIFHNNQWNIDQCRILFFKELQFVFESKSRLITTLWSMEAKCSIDFCNSFILFLFLSLFLNFPNCTCLLVL